MTATETQGTAVQELTRTTPPILVTEKAADEVRKHIADYQAKGVVEGNGTMYLRVRVLGGGCSGFKNQLDLDPEFNEKTDHKFESGGIEVVVDKRSMLYLEGATVDYHDGLNKSGFSISNPNAKSSCGCGSSYTV